MAEEMQISVPPAYGSGHIPRYAYGLLFLLLTVVALAVALQHYYIHEVNASARYTLGWHIPFNLVYWWLWLLFLPAMTWLPARLRVKTRVLKWAVFYVCLPIIVVLVHQVLASWIITSVLGYLDVSTLIYKRVLRSPWMGVDLVIYFSLMIGASVFEYQQRGKITELKRVQLQSQVAQSRLNALRSQIHPHFLFNTLNTLSTLILKEDNKEAERMLSLLHGFLNTTMEDRERDESTLEEELRFINQYLEIEKVRFADKLEVREDIDSETLEARVPTFLLQPIVENAVRHAIAPRTSCGILQITCRKENDQLAIEIDDNGPGMGAAPQKKPRDGVGLKITRERLQQLYGSDHRFELGDSPHGGMRVAMKIPFARARREAVEQ